MRRKDYPFCKTPAAAQVSSVRPRLGKMKKAAQNDLNWLPWCLSFDRVSVLFRNYLDHSGIELPHLFELRLKQADDEESDRRRADAEYGGEQVAD